MCNLYTFKLSRDEVKGLLEHYQLAGNEWARVFDKDIRELNESGQVYPGYSAPVVTVQDGEETLEKMRWGMPGSVFPPKPGENSPRCPLSSHL
jgi:putative SOS response-associated peptidase YedK